ncbi:3-methyl-2-oxobutanoate hydroxymethyltransferase [Actinidia chinensis var. chinensis]|uniref:3-methyl-2-oxobutanoate hydroxymethyltransferase n=1 Tax=Actinidia chinensis var. chinensis TaxID=1590841 RepID=A0A2R6S169_ACTCC|nr:3-methyl-2-oxobutanoate hydroxymethyltransferase [Actinidia chinensis var. chinensis]
MCFEDRSELCEQMCFEVFCWLAVQKKIATRDLLLRRNINMESNVQCPFRGLVEDLQITSFCSVYFLGKFGHNAWSGGVVNGYVQLKKFCWEVLFYAVFWTLWKVRNEVIFKGGNLDLHAVVELLKWRCVFWVEYYFKLEVFSVEDVIRCWKSVSSMQVRKL